MKPMDDFTRIAQGKLAYQHVDRIGAMLCRSEFDPDDLNLPVVFLEGLLMNYLDGDKDYQAAMDRIKAEYSEENRPPKTPREYWNTEKRLREFSLAFKHACTEGVFAQLRLEHVEDAL